MKKISLPLTDLKSLKAGQMVLLDGSLAVARDRTLTSVFSSSKVKFPGDGAVFYCGPVLRDGKIISAGPTTSSRMDWALPALLKNAVNIIIGKGPLSADGSEVLKHKAIYLQAPGGAGALLASSVSSFKTVAFSELGPQALMEFQVTDFPAIVAQDLRGEKIWREQKVAG